MMSTLNSSVYQRHLDHGTPTFRKRPVVGAPYVLCVFVVGVILMGVGTFVTSHAYEDDPKDPVLIVVGPTLLGLGGLLLVGSVVLCVVACCRNQNFHESMPDDLFSIGGSTFYGGRNFVQQDDEVRLHAAPAHHLHNSMVGGVVNPAGPPIEDHHSEAVRYLAKTVVEERNRRKNSQKYLQQNSWDSPVIRDHAPLYHTASHGPLREEAAHLDHLGLERLRRADPHLELAEAFDLDDDSEDYEVGVRERAYSMSVRAPAAALAPIPHRLRRNVTFSPASRARIQQQLLVQQQQQQANQHLQVPPELSGPRRKRSSRRRKARAKESDPSTVKIHQLPQYNPDILSALGIQPGRPLVRRGLSNGSHGSGSLKKTGPDPDVTHGSLGKPRRRPSMGVSSLAQTSSGSAYRHRSSIYASDMDLHRSPRGVGAPVNGSGMNKSVNSVGSSMSDMGREPCLPDEHRVEPAYGPPSSNGSVSDFRRIDSSPLLSLPDPAEESASPSPFHRPGGDYSTPPPSSSPSPMRHRRPLSHISSCCSDCCDCGDDCCGGEECKAHNERGDEGASDEEAGDAGGDQGSEREGSCQSQRGDQSKSDSD
ncbi:uncharacterized protein LOC119576963 [Penaeus monodon]|uniref:uncharacterized protein LOC119576963 n=1 Tax=Penaeus monodon TaxID=6687 RepID=UPI0018A760BB|nr:uncharacterized protein LOC119576963 [Penaeus monodon]